MSVARLAPKGYTSTTRPRVFLKSVLQSGVGRTVVQLKRANLQFCETSGNGRHVRKFVEENLMDFAQKHPSVALYVIPQTDMMPSIRVEYLNGRVENRSLRGLDHEQITEMMETYANRSGLELLDIKKPIHTDCPSIQGQWHPFLNKKNYDMNKELDFKVKKYDAWQSIGKAWTKCYRKSELSKLEKKVELTPEEKSSMPLGKYGPTLRPKY